MNAILEGELTRHSWDLRKRDVSIILIVDPTDRLRGRVDEFLAAEVEVEGQEKCTVGWNGDGPARNAQSLST